MFSIRSIKSSFSVSHSAHLLRNRRAVGSAIVGLLAAGWPCVGRAGIAPPQYNVIDLAALAGSDVGSANSINNSGQVVGDFQASDGHLHAFVYSAGTFRDQGTFGGKTSWARGINDAGQVAGSADTTDSRHAFLYSGGQMHDLGTLGGNSSTAFAIDSHGNVVGTSAVVTNPPDTYIHEHAFLDSNGVMVLLTPALTPAAVPLLPAAWTGLSTIALLAGVLAMRKRGRAPIAWPPLLSARPT